MRWIAGGIAGWLAAILPLLGVNIAGYAGVFDTQTAAVAGAAALVGGILLGGLVAGLIAGRSSATRRGGATATLPAGITAGALYVISLVAVVAIATRIDAAPAVVVDHPLRITGAIVCLGAILLGIALLVGLFVGRRGGSAAPQKPAVTRQQTPVQQPRYGQNPGTPPARDAYPDDDRDYRESGNRDNQRDYNGQGRGHGSYESGYNERQPARYPSSPSTSHSERDSGRDGDWR